MNLMVASTSIIENFINDASEENIRSLVQYSRNTALNEQQIASIAQKLANSGHKLNSTPSNPSFDIPSTGGPGSLSTLITPLILVALGKKVVKLGVSGRPAGGIDVLAQIKNYVISPSLKDINSWQDKYQYIHFISNELFTPLDIKIFNYRQFTNSVDIPALVTSSILSKKIASGVTNIGLDIRVSNFGNFGQNWDEARKNANLFNHVSSLLEIKSRCFISNGFYPPQPYIGRGESLLALFYIFQNRLDNNLKKHLGHCYSMAFSLTENSPVNIPLSILEKNFQINIENQNGDIESFYTICDKIEKEHIYTITAKFSGFLEINTQAIRSAIRNIQQEVAYEVFPDPCGIIIKSIQNQYIEIGNIICTYRCIKSFEQKFKKMLEACFSVKENLNLKEELEKI